ncbi:MAG: C10 family peptidase [Alistipes sp.]|nr:C10 family peptidase [Alistipes sp.]
MKKIFILFVLLCTSLTLSAGPIGEARARQIAEEFFAEHATTRSSEPLRLEWAGDVITEPISTGDKLNTSLMYIYTRGENSGFVVIAGDDNIHPIIGYSLNSTINTNDMAEATQEILDAWCKQIDAARKEQISACTTRTTTRSGDELLYETALWNQGEPYNREAPVIEGYKTITGCVATAMSIICHYNRWPERGIGTTPEYSYYDAYDVLRTVPENKLGRQYDYDNMLFDYNNGYTEEQGNAVAALMKDMGTSVKMMYYTNKSGESGAYDINVVQALTTYFGYSKSARMTRRDSYNIEEWNQIVRANLRECGPMYYSGGNGVGGHAFVIDGYSYNDYFHFNFGWGGDSNGWYLIPGIQFYLNQLTILGLTPDRDNSSSYIDTLYLVSLSNSEGYTLYRGMLSDATKYVTGNSYNFSIGGIYNYGARTFSGDVAIVHCNRNNEWKSVLDKFTLSDLSVENFIYGDDVYTITESIDSGDCIRIFYKSYDSNEWMLARRFNEDVIDKILLAASAEEVAETLIFHYDKEQNVIFLESPNAMQAELYRPSGEVTEVQEKAHGYIWYRILEGGEHILKVRSGGEPYELKFKL